MKDLNSDHGMIKEKETNDETTKNRGVVFSLRRVHFATRFAVNIFEKRRLVPLHLNH